MISSKMHGILLKVADRKVHIPLDVTLSFDEDYDPLAVQMIIEKEEDDDVVWMLSYELLARGALSIEAQGDGDVKVKASGTGALLVCLNNREGHADLALPLDRVIGFMDEAAHAYSVVDPEGSHLDDLIDIELRELLEEEA
jgi:hypothetical protein